MARHWEVMLVIAVIPPRSTGRCPCFLFGLTVHSNSPLRLHSATRVRSYHSSLIKRTELLGRARDCSVMVSPPTVKFITVLQQEIVNYRLFFSRLRPVITL